MTFSRTPGPVIWAQPGYGDFEVLFQQEWERLCHMLFGILGDWAEAQDLALEAFERLYHRPPPDPAHLAAWLYRVATRLGFNALRAHSRRRQYETLAAALALEDSGASGSAADPAAEVERSLEGQRVRRVLGRMKDRSARLLFLRHSGLSYAEVAATLEIAPASVGTLLARAEAEFERLYQQDVSDR